MSKDKLCNASFMFDESFCGGGWWLVDFISATFRFILLLVGGYLTRFLTRLSLRGVFYLFVMGPWWRIIYRKFWNWSWFEPDNRELIFQDSETTLSLYINEYWGRELFTHLFIKFSSKPFEVWDCDLPFTSFGKHSFRKFWCSTRVAFSRETITSSLILCLSRSNDCSNNLSCLCARSSACLAASFACSGLLRRSLTDTYDVFVDPVVE